MRSWLHVVPTILLCLLGRAFAQTANDTRLLIPDAAAQKESLKLVQEVFKDDIDNAKTPDQKTALAERLIQQASESKDDPAGTFVLLQTALDRAAEAADIATALKAVDAMAKTFQIDAGKQSAGAISKFLSTANLSLANSAALKELAAKETTEAASPAQQVKLGDGWWDLAQKAVGRPKNSMLARAGKWYQQAAPGLTGLTKAKVDKRLAEISPDSKPVVAADDAPFAFRRIELSLGADGHGEMTVDSRLAAAELPPPPDKTGINVPGIKGAHVEKVGGSDLHVIYDFRSVKDVDDLESWAERGQPTRLAIDQQTGRLLLPPWPPPREHPAGFCLASPRPFRLPLKLTLYLEYRGAGQLQLVARVGGDGLHAHFSIAGENGHVAMADQRNGKDQVLFEFDLRKGSQQKREFQLDMGNHWKGGDFWMAYVADKGSPPLPISRVEITGSLGGRLNVQLNKTSNRVVIFAILEGTGAKSGLQPGDTITAINGVPIGSDLDGCVEKIHQLTIGTPATIGVIRSGKPMDVSVTPE